MWQALKCGCGEKWKKLVRRKAWQIKKCFEEYMRSIIRAKRKRKAKLDYLSFSHLEKEPPTEINNWRKIEDKRRWETRGYDMLADLLMERN